MWKSIVGTGDKSSSVSSSKRERRRDDDETTTSRSSRARANSNETSSSSRRKSSRRDDPDQTGGFNPTSTSFSSSSRTPYAGVAAPSVASSYNIAHTHKQTDAPIQPRELMRNESMADKVPRSERREYRRESSKRDSRSDPSCRTRGIDDNDEDGRNAGRDNSESRRRRGSRKSSKRKDTASRAVDNHNASLVENQFPGQEPAAYTEAYRPPGLASDYYGDNGESVANQPGVRPNAPDVIQTADQAHLWEPLAEAKPPPEPSSLGQTGAASSYFGNNDMNSGDENAASTPSRASLRPAKYSQTGASPRSSPGPEGRPPRPFGNSMAMGAGAMAAAGMGAAAMSSRHDGGRPQSSDNVGGRPPMPTNASGHIGVMGSGSMAAGVGAAADYYTGDIRITTGNTPPPVGQNHQVSGSQSYQQTETLQTGSSSRPPRQSGTSNALPYGAAAAAGLAGAAYLAHEHHESEHHQSLTQHAGQSSNAQFVVGQGQSAFPEMQQRHRHKHRGPFGKVIEWFQDPNGVAEFEAYSEAIGLCKYCFDPNSSPKDAPRKHNYRSRRYSGGRYGSSTRVDKVTRYSSDEERRRTRPSYSTTEKVAGAGLAAAGVGLVGEALYKHKNDFDDTYSVKSGRPGNKSRVSFQEQEDERYSVSRRRRRGSTSDEVRLSRRDSDRRKEKRSSRRRDSSDSENHTGGISRGAALSTAGLAAVGAAGVAAVAADSRRRSRSPKKKNRKGYYHNRVSPRHSYVDLTTTTLGDGGGGGGPLGMGSFFSSPSANERRKKKPKGIFNFNNGSGSSSDADLAFGEGTVKRHNSRKSNERKNTNDTAAILGLAATGAALAAESKRREDRKGKRRETADDRDSGRDSRSRRTSNKIKMQDPYVDSADNGEEGIWEDATDDDAHSIDIALAYGGGLSTRQSRDSLNDGTSKWGWRWGSRQQNEEKKEARRKSSKVDLSGYDEVGAGLVGGGLGAAAASAYSYQSNPGLPAMQYVDPVPLDTTPRPSRMSVGISPRSSVPPQSMATRTSASVPLVAPQPVTPISQQVYEPFADVPTGTPVFDKSNPMDRIVESPTQNAADFERSSQSSRILPTAVAAGAIPIVAAAAAVLPSRKESVKFDLTTEQVERERKARERERTKREKDSAPLVAKPAASIITGPERSPERRLETWRLRDAVMKNPPELPKLEEAKEEPRRTSVDERGDRISEIDRQLQELYEEAAKQEARKMEKGREGIDLTTTVTGAAAAAAIGAGVIAVKSHKSRSETEDGAPRTPRRKSSLKKSSRGRDTAADFSPPDPSTIADTPSSSAEKIARMAAQRVRSTPSPVHEDYGSFFVPEELAGNVKKHNARADQRDLDEEREAQIVDVVPRGERKEWYEAALYHPYGTEDTDVPPTKLPWKVPHLDLVSPTPPVRSPVLLAVSGKRDVDEEAEQRGRDDGKEYERERVRSGSKVTWGDHEINVYEVMTPEYERDGHEFTTTPAATTPKHDSPLREVVTVVADDPREQDETQRVPPVEKMTKEQQEHVGMGKDFADLPSSPTKTREIPAVEDIKIPAIEELVPRDVLVDEVGSQQSFYTSSFAQTVSDLGIMGDYSGKPVPAEGQGFVEEEISEMSRDVPVPVPEVPVNGAGTERLSKSERRRRERAEAAAAAPTAMVTDTEPVAKDIADQPPIVPGGVNVFDYIEDANGETMRSASVLATSTSVLSGNSNTQDLPRQSEEAEFAKPKRVETFDEEGFVERFPTPISKSNYTSDPEEWERETPRRATAGDIDFYAGSSNSGKKSRKSKRDSEVFKDDTGSAVSSPAELRTDKKKRRSSKRDSESFDDDAKSVASEPATEKEKRRSKSLASDSSTANDGKRKSKDGKKSGLSGWGLVGAALFSSASKSDVSSKRSSKSDESDKKRRKSKDRADFDDDATSESRRSRSRSDSSVKVPEPRDQSVDDSFVSADEGAPNGHGDTKEVDVDETTISPSFLAERPEMPTGSDGASGLMPESNVQLENEQTPLAETPTKARELIETTESAEKVTPANEAGSYFSGASASEPRQRRLSNLRTTDLVSSPMATSSPTAVPIRFGRLPISPGNVRTGSVGSPTMQSPSSPLATPRTRQGRPTSTEFRSSKEFRPLYLVERHSYARKPPTTEEEEQYPSLPSSRTSSAHPSIEDLRGHAVDDLDLDLAPERSWGERQRRYSTSYWGDNSRARAASSPDFLDSGTATPVQAHFPEIGSRREVREGERPKYEFHSPSELLEDPSQHQHSSVPEPSETSPLPSVVGTEKSFSRPASPAEEEKEKSSSNENISIGIAAGLAGGAAVLVRSQVVDSGEEKKRRASSAANHEPLTREVEVSALNQDAKEGFDLQSISSKSTPKDLAQPNSEDPTTAVDTSHDLALPAAIAGSAAALAGAATVTSQAEPDVPTSTRDATATAPTPGIDETDLTAGLDELTTHKSYPFPSGGANDLDLTRTETLLLPALPEGDDTDLALARTESYVPSSHDFPHLSAFEAAFERAIQARGLPTGVSREDAMGVFLPKRENAPFLEKGTLTPIGEVQSAVPSPVGTEEEEQMGMLETIEEVRTLDEAPGEMPTEMEEARSLTEEPAPIQEEEAWIPPSTSKKDKKKKKSMVTFEDHMSETVATRSRDIEKPIEEAVTAPVEEDDSAWVSPSTSEKDKKKKKKGSVAMAADTELEHESTSRNMEEPLETPSEPVAEESMQEEAAAAWIPPSTPKKDKKKKKKKSLVIFEDPDVAPETTLAEEASKQVEPAEIETQPLVETPLEDFSFAPTSSKKTKKGKKKAVATFDDLEGSETLAPEETRDLVGVTEELAPETAIPVASVEPAEETPEDFAWAPTKSKKDKKKLKKNKELAADDGADSSDVPATPIVVEEPLEPASEPRQIDHIAPLVHEPMEIAQLLEKEATDDFAPAPTKKSKKDKKAKKSLGFDNEVDSSELPTTASEPRELGDDTSSTPVAAGLAAGALANLAATSLMDGSTEQKQPEEDWAPTPMKKSKKDKKKGKKGTSFSLDDGVEESTSVNATQDLNSEVLTIAEDRAGSTLNEPATVDEVERQADFTEKLSGEPDAELEIPVDEEDTWASTPRGSKKKGKKGKKGQSLAASDDERTQAKSPGEDVVLPESESAREVVTGASTAPPAKVTDAGFPTATTTTDHVDDVVSHYHGMLRAYEPRLSAPDNKPRVSRQSLQPQLEFQKQEDCDVADTMPSAAADKPMELPDEPAKEVFQHATEISQQVETEPEDDFMAQYARDRAVTRREEEIIVASPVQEKIDDVEPPAAAEEELYPVLSEKSKKDKKKKKRQSTFDDFDTAPTTSTDDISMPTIVTGAAAADAATVAGDSSRDIAEPATVTKEEPFVIPSKKSKKEKKKKRQSVVENIDKNPEDSQATMEDPRLVLAEDAFTEEPRDMGLGSHEEFVEPPATIEEGEPFTTSTKRSKKDKKKKRQSMFDDFDTQAPVDSRGGEVEPKETFRDDANTQDPEVVETASKHDIVDPSAPLEDESSGFSTKKSQEDKKKTPQSTFEDLELLEEPQMATEELKEAVEYPEVQQPQELEHDSQPIVVGSSAPVEDEFPGFSTKNSKRDKKKKRQSTLDDLDTAQTTSTDDLFASKEETTTGTNTESQREIFEPALAVEKEQFITSTKKLKKDKKKKKTVLSWADEEGAADSTSQPTESSTPAEFNEAREALGDETETRQAITDEEMVTRDEAKPVAAPIDMVEEVVSHDDASAMRHEKRRSQSIPGGWDMDEDSMDVDTIEQAREAEPEVIPEALKTEADKKVLGLVMKKSKKDKKGKKNKTAFEEDFPEPTREREPEVEALPTTIPSEEVAESRQIEQERREDVREEEWGFPTKKSRKDQKSRRARDSEPELARDVEELPPVDSSQQSSKETAEEEEFMPTTKKSKKDKKGKKGKRDSVREITEGVPEGTSALLPTQDPSHVDDVVGHYYGMLRDYRPAESAPDNKKIQSTRDISVDPAHFEPQYVEPAHFGPEHVEPAHFEPEYVEPAHSRLEHVDHIDDVTTHYFGMLRNYEPAPGAPDNKPAVSARDIQPPVREERAYSPVSDEDSKRARRKNRKASPVYSGEEPGDLPGRRGYTAPAERDDMMDTALGVAAGLGLTGAASHANSNTGEPLDIPRDIDKSRSPARSGELTSWSFANLPKASDVTQRDSGIQFADSPTLPQDRFGAHDRDSGYVQSPANRTSWQGATRGIDLDDRASRPPRPPSPTSSSEDLRSKRRSRDLEETPARKPSPVVSTSKDRSSKLFDSSPSNRNEAHGATSEVDATPYVPHPATDIHYSPTIHDHSGSRDELGALRPSRSREMESRHVAEGHGQQLTSPEPHRSIFGPYSTPEGHERGFSPPKTPLHTIHEQTHDISPSLHHQREPSDAASPDQHRSIQHRPSGGNLRDMAGIAGAAAIGGLAGSELSNTSRDEPASRAKSLGRSKARTSSSRSLRRSAQFDPGSIPSSSTHDLSHDKGKGTARDMSDVFDGIGEFPGAPMSPTRPPSVRKRQSMQQIKDLELRLDQLASENRLLAEAKIAAERHLEDYHLENTRSEYASQEAVDAANLQLREKDEEIQNLRDGLEWMKQEVARLSEANTGLNSAHEDLRFEHEQLGNQHAETHQSWQESSRDLDTLRSQHNELSAGMEDIVRHEIDTAIAEKNVEIERLHSDLEVAKDKIQELQQQILGTGADDVINSRDEDYFESACQSLCQHVQQWVLRFSKFSDTLVCRTTNQVRDEKIVDRFDNAVLDGSDVDVYLSDRVKRRDVFMSVVMTMIWEYIFTRYLFGMDREQRQKLKQLEKNLAEVGSPSAVHHWRAMTLTLLAKREVFKSQRENDTEAVANEIYDNLSRFLPPPQNLQKQVQDSLRNVLRTAVDLSIEMRTQRAEYIMLPPLQPEYDPNTGDLARQVYFNASLMNERSGETTSNNELEQQQAVVRMVLFPLVVKKGSDTGEGDEEIVVCPAQVLVARPDRGKKARVVSAQSDRMSIDPRTASRHSLAGSTMDMSNVI